MGSGSTAVSRFRLIRGFLASTAIGAAWPLMAQEAPPEATAAAPVGGEIIVTATRRAESLQRVPISIQALGEEMLEQRQVSSFDDYARMLPSVSFDSFGPSQAQIYFRGINSGGDGLDVGSLPTTGVYLDEIPVTTIGAAVDLHIYDIDRVEALAGPQGTLFGASSLSGTLRIITNKPDPSRFEGGVDLELNKFGKGDVGGGIEGFVNIPVAANAAIRLVGYYEQAGGYVSNTYRQRTFTLDDFDPTTNVVVDNSAFLGNDLNDVESYGGRAALRVDLDENWTVTPQIIYQRQKSHGSFTFDPRAGDLEVHDFQDNVNLDRWYQAALTIEGKIGSWDLVYSGGYFERKIDNANDYSYYSVAYDTYSADAGAPYAYYYTTFPDGLGGFLDPTQQQYLDYDYTKQTHELRVNSPSAQPFRITLGAFFQRQTGELDSDYSVAGAGEVPPGTVFPNLYPVPGFGDATFVKRLDRVDRDYALFAEGNYDLTPDLTLTAGIRGFRVRNSLYGFSGLARNTLADCVAVDDPRYPCVNVVGDLTAGGPKRFKETGETHKLSLAYRFDPRRMVYATYSTGYRPGGNDRRFGVPPYKSDTISNYEIGWKTSWLDGQLRLNGAVFYQKWDDIQFAQPGENGVTYLLNAGGAEVKGIEADVLYRIGGLQLSAAGAYLDAKLDDDFCDDGGCTPDGTRLPVTPKFKGSATARYGFPVGSADGFVQGTIFHQSNTRAALLEADVVDLGYTPGFTTFDFSAGATFGSISVAAFIDNAFDKRGELSRNTACAITLCNQNYRIYPVKPQLFGVKVAHRF